MRSALDDRICASSLVLIRAQDKSFSLELKTPPASFLLKEKAGVKLGSAKGATKGATVGSVTMAQVWKRLLSIIGNRFCDPMTARKPVALLPASSAPLHRRGPSKFGEWGFSDV